jgi:hypothetical protein
VDKHKTLTTLNKLIRSANVRIDRLILLDKPYAKEAQEHKRLVATFRKLAS